MNEVQPLLGQWANFYLITSASAASLIGLLFVVITFAAQRAVDKAKGAAEARMYLTPTVFYFASVLVVAALLTFPSHTPLTASLCTCLAGIVGLSYAGAGFFGDRNRYEQRRDLITHAVLPFAAYGLLISGGVLVLHDPQRGLTFVALGLLSLLTIAIRNSWAIVIGIVFTRRG